MPPDDFTPVTISDGITAKLAQIMSRHECENYAVAVDYAVNVTLAQKMSCQTRI